MVTKIELLITRVSTLLNQHLAGLVRHRARDIDIEQIGNETGTVQVILDRLIAAGSLHAKAVNYLTDLRAITNPEEFRVVNTIGYSSPVDGGGGYFYYDGGETATDNNGLIVKPNHITSGPGRWKRLYSGSIDIRWFGARGGGSNDTTPIQKALDTAASLGVSVFIPAGTFSCSGLTSSLPLTVQGASRATSILKQLDHCTSDMFTATKDLRLEHLGFDGNKATQDLTTGTERKAIVVFDGSTANLFVEDCDFLNTTAAGIHVTVAEKDVIVRGCAFRNQADANGLTLSYPNDAGAIFISTGSKGNIVITDSVFEQDIPLQGRSFTVDVGTNVFTSTAHGCNDTEPVQFRSSGSLPSPLVVDTVYYVRDKTTDTFKIEASIGGGAIDITTSGTGILELLCVARNAAGIQVRGNEPSEQGGIDNNMSLTLSNCYFRGLGNIIPGIGNIDLYDFMGKSVIHGNRFHECTGVAIKTSNSPALTIVGNTITQKVWSFNAGAIFYSAAGHVFPTAPYPDVAISANAIKNWHDAYGIHLVGAGNTPTDEGVDDLHGRGLVVTGNTLDQCGSGIWCDGIADSILSDNYIGHAQKFSFDHAAILVYRSTGTVTIQDNTIHSPIGYGIVGYLETQPTLRLVVKGNTIRSTSGYHSIIAASLKHFECSNNSFFGTSPVLSLHIQGGAGPNTLRAVIRDNHADSGNMTAFAQSGSGPAITLTGTPKGDRALRIEITTAGTLGSGVWRWSKDGGSTFEEAGITLPISGTYELGSLGVTANFSSGIYVLNETYDSTLARKTGLVSVIADDYIHDGNSWDTLLGNGALLTVTVNSGTQSTYNIYPDGVDIGDIVVGVSCDQDLQGLELFGSVTATNGVKLYFTNPTVGNITLTDARFQVKVQKRVLPQYTPDDASTLAKLWLAADGPLTKDGSNLVSAWRDKSRNDYMPAKQATGANQLLWVDAIYNGKPTLRSGDATDSLTFSTGLDLGAGGSVVWAMKASSIAAYEWATNAGNGVISKVSGNLTEWLNGADRYTFVNNPTGLHIYAITQGDSGNITLYFDGAIVVGPVAATVAFPDIVNIFGRGTGASGTDGDIPEYMAFSGELYPGEVKSLSRMLGTKYNVAVA